MRSSPRSPSRRTVLGSLGMGAAAHLLPSLRASAADGIPKRCVFIYTQHGTLPQFWDPVGVGGAAPSESSFELGELLRPLAPYKNDLVLLSGFDMRSQTLQSNPGDAHQQSQGHSLTGIALQSATLAGGPSIDQTIVEGLKAANGGQTPTLLPSLHLGATENGPYTAWGHPFYYGAGRIVPIDYNMTTAFRRLFPTGGAPTAPGGEAAAAAALARRKSALDLAAAEFKRVAPALSKDDGVKFENHADALSDLQSRLKLAPTRSCTTPSTTMTGNRWQGLVDVGTRLAHAALACDLTRVVALHWDEVPNALSGYSGGSFGTTDSHDLVHKTDPGNGALASNAQAVAVMKKYHTVYAERVAGFLKLLKETPESDGKSLLDHTAVLWCGESASGGHTAGNVRWVLAGSCQGAWRTGRYLALSDPKRSTFSSSNTAPTHQNLFVSMAKAMGVNIESFGDMRTGRGTIARL